MKKHRTMDHPMKQGRIGLVLLTLMAACGGGPKKSSELHPSGPGPDPLVINSPLPTGQDPNYLADDPQPAAWTQEFLRPATLLADRIRIEGPHGLLDHLVVRSDDQYFLRTAKATTAGLLQVTRPRSSAGGELVGAQLDRWQLGAFEEISVLVNPALTSVRVVAEGDAFWRTPDGTEKRGARLAFDKPVQQP
ncbi:MAG TPA: hypothetical protein EYQ25_12750 [Planctomycetes bacterium]|nr:hypothetical protein [Planctomycetota bacterium]HIL37125.1 hypothetical protein [Planctomycetota bacterium]